MQVPNDAFIISNSKILILNTDTLNFNVSAEWNRRPFQNEIYRL